MLRDLRLILTSSRGAFVSSKTLPLMVVFSKVEISPAEVDNVEGVTLVEARADALSTGVAVAEGITAIGFAGETIAMGLIVGDDTLFGDAVGVTRGLEVIDGMAESLPIWSVGVL